LVNRLEAGLEIKKVRESRELSQSQLAKIAGVPTWAVSQAETGGAVGDKFNKIREATGLAPVEQFDKEPVAPAKQKRKPRRVTKSAAVNAPSPVDLAGAVIACNKVLRTLSPDDRAVVMKILAAV
jgi:DNA-binding XRE family transcriptional regulator